MITVETWVPGSNQMFDELFEKLREDFYKADNHILCKNYVKEHFEKCSALSIAFKNDNPIFCSSILNRSVWPSSVYRIGNRFWRVGDEHHILQRISPGVGEMLKSQIDWLKDNSNYKLVFVSRQYDNWQEFMVQDFKKNFQIDFEYDNYKYCTCETPNDTSCWQKIIYYGDSSVLESWSRK